MKNKPQSAAFRSTPGQTREPLIHIVKRAKVPLLYSILIKACAIVSALIFCAVLTILVTGDDPISIYKTMWQGAFGKEKILLTFQELAMLLGVSLAVTPAFKMRFWNIGAEGQVLFSALITAICMLYLGDVMPTWLLMLTLIAASILAGVVWAFIPALFKAIWNTNETLFTLMMNYVAIQAVQTFLKIADKSGSNTVGPTMLTRGWFPQLFGKDYILNIIIVALLTVLVFVYLKYTKHGYEISVVGQSEKTAKYIGINVKKVIIRTMIVSGALCGVIGLLLVSGSSHSIDPNLVKGRGFTAIMVSWLAKFNPLTMVFSALLIVFLGRGAEEVTTGFHLNSSFSDILTGVILFFIIGSEFFIQYRIVFRRRKSGKEGS